MNNNNSHIIQKILVDVNTSSLQSGNYFKDNFLKYLNEILLPLLEKRLDEINVKTGNYDIRLEELSLAVDLNSIEDYATMNTKIVPKITQQIIKRIDKELLDTSVTKTIIKDVQKSQKEFLKEFLTKGKFPWWFSEDQIDLETIDLKNYVEVTALKNTQFKERLINQFEDFQLLDVVKNILLKITDVSYRKTLANLISKFYNHTYLYKNVTLKERTKIWNKIFSVLLKANDENSSDRFETSFLKEFKEEVKANSEVETLFNHVLKKLSKEKQSLKISKDLSTLEEEILLNKQVLEKKQLQKTAKQLKDLDVIYKNQLKNINNQFHEISNWFALIEDEKALNFDEEIRNLIFQLLQHISISFFSEKNKYDIEKLKNNFNKQIVFYVKDVKNLLQTVVSCNQEILLNFSSFKRTEFYTIVHLSTKLHTEIENLKSLKELVGANTIKEEVKILSKNIEKDFTTLLKGLKKVTKRTEIIIDVSTQKTILLLLEILFNKAINKEIFLEIDERLKKIFESKSTIHFNDVICLIETILSLKETTLLTFYTIDDVAFCKMITLIEKVKKNLQKTDFLEMFITVDDQKKTSNLTVNKIEKQTKLKTQLHKNLDLEIYNKEINKIPTKRNITALNINKVTYLENAGLILIHPFLKFFFINIGMYDKETNNLKNPAKAAHLLHYIATKKEHVFENEMIFEKILCGIPLEQSINRFIKISKKEKEEAENMLKAMLSNWEKMEKASPDLLRNEFLQREGKLILNNEKLTLKIAYKTQDVLLNKLNWSISLIKLPWLDSIINVEWC